MEEMYKRPVLLILEEAQEYIATRSSGRIAPPWVYQRMVRAFRDCFLQGRKLNVSAIAVSPRPQEVNFSVRQTANLTFYGRFSAQDIEYLAKECLKWHRHVEFDPSKLLSLKPGEWLAVSGADVKYIRVTEPRRTKHGAETPKIEWRVPRTEESNKVIQSLAAELTEALMKAKAEESELAKALTRIRELEEELEEARKEIERLRIALSVKESIKIEAKPIEITIPEIKQATHPFLPSIVDRLDEDGKQVFYLLKHKPGLHKIEIMAALGWGRRRLERVLKSLKTKRLIKVSGRRFYAQEPII